MASLQQPKIREIFFVFPIKRCFCLEYNEAASVKSVSLYRSQCKQPVQNRMMTSQVSCIWIPTDAASPQHSCVLLWRSTPGSLGSPCQHPGRSVQQQPYNWGCSSWQRDFQVLDRRTGLAMRKNIFGSANRSERSCGRYTVKKSIQNVSSLFTLLLCRRLDAIY